MRRVDLYRLVVDDGVGRSGEFPLCHDAMLRGGGVFVWRMLPLGLSYQRVGHALLRYGGRYLPGAAVCRLRAGGGAVAENHFGHFARLLDYCASLAVLHSLRGVGRLHAGDAGEGAIPVAVYHRGVAGAHPVSVAHRAGLHLADGDVELIDLNYETSSCKHKEQACHVRLRTD